MIQVPSRQGFQAIGGGSTEQLRSHRPTLLGLFEDGWMGYPSALSPSTAGDVEVPKVQAEAPSSNAGGPLFGLGESPTAKTPGETPFSQVGGTNAPIAPSSESPRSIWAKLWSWRLGYPTTTLSAEMADALTVGATTEVEEEALAALDEQCNVHYGDGQPPSFLGGDHNFTRFAYRLSIKAKLKFGYDLKPTVANRQVVHEWLVRHMRDMNVRTTHIARVLPIAIPLVFVKDKYQLDADNALAGAPMRRAAQESRKTVTERWREQRTWWEWLWGTSPRPLTFTE